MIIEICAVRPKSLLTAIAAVIIMFFQKRNYSHYMIVCGDFTLDSKSTGTQWSLTSSKLDFYSVKKVWKFEVDTSIESIRAWSKKYEGDNYSLLQNIGAGLKYVGFLKHNPFGNDENSLNCSELAALFARDFLGAKLIDSDQYDLVLTEQLLDDLKKVV